MAFDPNNPQDQFADRWSQAQHAELIRQRRRDGQEPDPDEAQLNALIDARIEAAVATGINRLTIKNGQNITFTGAGYNITGSVILPPIPPLQPTVGGASGGGTHENPYVMDWDTTTTTQFIDTWDIENPQTDTDGVFWSGPRIVTEFLGTYNAEKSGGGTLEFSQYDVFFFTRDVTFDSSGNLVAISAETKISFRTVDITAS